MIMLWGLSIIQTYALKKKENNAKILICKEKQLYNSEEIITTVLLIPLKQYLI